MTSRMSQSTQTILIGFLTILPLLTSATTAFAQTQNQTRQVFEINNFQTITIPTPDELMNKPQTKPQPETPVVDPDIAVLQDYLNSKGSPLAPYAADILQYDNWKLVLAISNGESTMCKHQLYNNCWGVGGAWNLRHYASFSAGFSDVDRFLGEKYIAQGADTPKEIVHKYVGSHSGNWVKAVNQILVQLDQLPLTD